MNEKEKLAARIVFSDSLGKEMKTIRLEKGLSQKGLAERMKISSSVLSDYEGGRRKNPGVGFVKKFLDNIFYRGF